MDPIQSLLGAFLRYTEETGEEIPYLLDADLAAYSTMRCGGHAAILATPKSEDALIYCVTLAESLGLPTRLLGRGSNTLFLSGRHLGLFLSTERLSTLVSDGKCVTAACGASLIRFLTFLQSEGFSGGEPLFGIPGSLGGAIYMNAGAYGGEISDHLLQSTVWDPACRCVRTLSRQELGFSYRKSLLQEEKKWICLQSSFSFPRDTPEQIRAKMHTFMQKRRKTQPLAYPSLGSIFRRVDGVPIARLIDELGLRGYRRGGAAVSEIHAGFIINQDHATPEEILSLVEEIQDRVYQAYGILPVPEIEIVR